MDSDQDLTTKVHLGRGLLKELHTCLVLQESDEEQVDSCAHGTDRHIHIAW